MMEAGLQDEVPEQGSNPLLLLVEDEAILLDALELLVSEQGYDSVLARNAEEAFRALESYQERLKGIITDIFLGESASGWEIARRARVSNPLLPIVYLSGDNATGWPSEGVPNSVVIAKPFAPAQVVVAITNLLNEAEQKRVGSAA